MSQSKFTMAKKLHNVQVNLMDQTIKTSSFDSLLPLIFKECHKENLTFWFNFIEKTCVLNLRDIEHENHELNIRYTYESANLLDENQLNFIKETVLMNTFLITKESHVIASSAKTGVSSDIISGDSPVPVHIRKAIEKIKAKGLDVTPEAIQNHLPTGQMSSNQIMACNKYLKQMTGGNSK